MLLFLAVFSDCELVQLASLSCRGLPTWQRLPKECHWHNFVPALIAAAALAAMPFFMPRMPCLPLHAALLVHLLEV